MGLERSAIVAEQSRLSAASDAGSRAPQDPERASTARGGAEAAGGGAAGTRAPERLEFARVYEAEFDFVWRSLRLLGVGPDAAEDATQDVFSVVYRRLGEFEGRSSLRTWLFAILQRVAQNQRRSTRRKQDPLTELDDATISRLPTPLAQLEVAESIDIVQSFCDTLDPERRAVFVLALLEELPASEVSQTLGIPVNTVYSRVRHLREGLRRLLDDEDGRR